MYLLVHDQLSFYCRSLANVLNVYQVISVSPDLWEKDSGKDEDLVKKWVFLGDDRTIRRVYTKSDPLMKVADDTN